MALEEFYDTKEGKKLILHAGKDASDKAFLYFTNDTIVIAESSGKSGIVISKDFGVGIQGPLSIITQPESIRVAGLWTVNPLVLTALPSTLLTPVSWLKQSLPTSTKELVKGLVEVASMMVGL
jgi:hypothetical protein